MSIKGTRLRFIRTKDEKGYGYKGEIIEGTVLAYNKLKRKEIWLLQGDGWQEKVFSTHVKKIEERTV